VSALEAKECGFVAEIAEFTELDAKVDAICAKLLKNAPLTMRASKEALRRLVAAGIPDGDDLVRSCYGSRDFKIGVDSFMEKKRPVWTGS
jgi:enoyl-CoA hydratase